jgi:hypothetical protein
MSKIQWKKAAPILGIVIVLVAGYMIYRQKFAVRDEVDVRNLRTGKGGPCPGERVRLVMGDVYMRGIIEEGEKFDVIMNYYACNPFKRGDYILQHLSASMDPVVKILRGLPGDKFELSKDSGGRGWNLVINGDPVMWEAENKPYFFGGKQAPTLALYEKSRKGILGADEIIILGNWPPGNNDSGIFGVFSINDVLGKVIPLNGKEAAEEKPADEAPTPADESQTTASPAATATPAARPTAPAKGAGVKSPAKSSAKPKAGTKKK